jgi:hypothetical protein
MHTAERTKTAWLRNVLSLLTTFQKDDADAGGRRQSSASCSNSKIPFISDLADRPEEKSRG